jgi:hypothetical protein
MTAVRRLSPVAFAIVVSIPLTMCGGAASEKAPAASPSPAEYNGPPGYPSSPPASDAAASAGAAAPSQPGALSPPPPPQAAGTPTDQDTLASRKAAARGDFDHAQRDLQAAANDCASACKALASMDRAASHMCELADTPEDQRRCDDAKVRLGTARERVRSACGTCP